MKQRTFRSILYSIFISAILVSCAGGIPVPGLETPTPIPPTPTPYQQALPPSLVETAPLQNTVIGQLSPLTFYFNEPMDKSSVETAFGGLPEGTFTWNDGATVVFNPTQPYSAKSELPVTIASSIKSSTGFGIEEPIDLSFAVADYLRATNILPKENAADVDVEFGSGCFLQPAGRSTGCRQLINPSCLQPATFCERERGMDQHQHLYLLPGSCDGRGNAVYHSLEP